jgi:hypothetical protein
VSTRIPRLTMEELDPQVAAALGPRVARLGYLGEFFQVGGNQPAPLLDFISYTENSKKGLPEKLVELIALTVSTRVENTYERHQHERLCLKLGFGDAWIKAVQALDPSLLAEEEAAVQRFVLAALANWGHGTMPEIEALVDAVGPQATVAVLFVLGRYFVHALFVNALELRPPVPSIFEAPDAS